MREETSEGRSGSSLALKLRCDLFRQQSGKLIHATGLEIPCAAVSPIKGGVAWWNVNSMLAAAEAGGMIGASVFSLNPIKGRVQLEVRNNRWRVNGKNSDGSARICYFELPDREMAE